MQWSLLASREKECALWEEGWYIVATYRKVRSQKTKTHCILINWILYTIVLLVWLTVVVIQVPSSFPWAPCIHWATVPCNTSWQLVNQLLWGHLPPRCTPLFAFFIQMACANIFPQASKNTNIWMIWLDRWVTEQS